MVRSAGRSLRDNIAEGISGFGFPGFGFFARSEEKEGKAGRSLFSEEVDSMANAVRKAVEVYNNLSEVEEVDTNISQEVEVEVEE